MTHNSDREPETDPIEVLESVQSRVLWLATSLVHHANHVRENRSGIKIGGHQASSASMVSIMTALYFDQLRSEDLVSVKPHASPVLHAINYLLGRLDESYLTELRSFHGLQSYPSRDKDPDPVDFSTGSVGLGATATVWSALTRRYLAERLQDEGSGRHIALVGDAELDEGAIWEALADPMVGNLSETLWIVDLNRQSLDRIVPDVAVKRINAMFEAVGWQTVSVKYGRRLRALFDLPDGEALRDRIDDMSNEEYQRLMWAPPEERRDRLCSDSRSGPALRKLLSDVDDQTLATAVRDLGGHDLADLSAAVKNAEATTDRPTVIFAYTLKAWRLPTEGHPGNHSTLLTPDQWVDFADTLGADSNDPWARFAPGSPEQDLCEQAAARLQRGPATPARRPDIPVELGRSHSQQSSSQQALGRFLSDLASTAPETAQRVVTVSPDVASSTNLGGWINKVGVWNPHERTNWFADDPDVLVKWEESRLGQHIELGIAEGNLVGLLSELGATWSRYGQPLFPIGTIYDPFVTRALEPWSFGIYAGGQSILVGTPSGVTLAPEGGVHQSVITASVGLEQPRCISWEPCFAQDLEWTMLRALSLLGQADGESSYFRLSTRPVDQSLARVPSDPTEREQRRRSAIAGGYLLHSSSTKPQITLVGMGTVVPEVVAAADVLMEHGVEVDVVCVTSADLLFRASRSRRGLTTADSRILSSLLPQSRKAPMVTVLDGHPHTLSFLSSIHGVQAAHLGVDDFGQTGEISDLYELFGIDTQTIVGTAWDLLDELL